MRLDGRAAEHEQASQKDLDNHRRRDAPTPNDIDAAQDELPHSVPPMDGDRSAVRSEGDDPVHQETPAVPPSTSSVSDARSANVTTSVTTDGGPPRMLRRCLAA